MVQSAPAQHHTRLFFRSIYSMRRTKLHCRKGAVFHFPAAGHKTKRSQWIDSLTINLESQAKIPFVVPAARLKNRKLQLPKNNKPDQSEWLPQHRGNRGPDCLLKWSQSISSPSPNTGWQMNPVTACQPPTEIKEHGQTTAMKD